MAHAMEFKIQPALLVAFNDPSSTNCALKVRIESEQFNLAKSLASMQGADDATVQEAGGDVGVLARSHRAYARAGLGPKESKAVRFADRADVWGASVASALVAEIDREAADPALHRTKGIVCLDSDVVVGAGSKGRSSSRELNRPLRRGAPTLLLTRMQRGYVHVRSDFNPADDPTRRRAVRGPRTAPPPWAESVREEGVRALETAYPALGARRGPARGVFRTPDDEAPPA